MNNFCTNCGKKLGKDEIVCRNCNTPIVELPYNYEYKSPEQKKRRKKYLIIKGICVLSFFAILWGSIFINKVKVKSLQKEYVDPYLKQNYTNLDYSIEYISSGKCIISGNCYFDPIMGCHGGACQKYEYLDSNECKSYYYSIKTDTNDFIITVVNKDKVYSVVEGRNIYGFDEVIDSDESFYDQGTNDNTDASSTDLIS